MWIRSLSLEAREAACAAAATRDDPDIVRVSETDLSGADGRRAQEARLPSMAVLCADFWIKDQKTEYKSDYGRDAAGHAKCILQDCGLETITEASRIISY